MAFRFYFYLCITLEIYNMEKIVIAILLLISGCQISMPSTSIWKLKKKCGARW